MLKIRFILIWIRILGSVSWNSGSCSGSGSCSISDLKSGKYKLLFYFFSIKNIFLRNMIRFVIYVVNFYVCKHKFNSLKKMYDILMNFVDFHGNFPWFWLIYCYPDPDPADQNETDLKVNDILKMKNIAKKWEEKIVKKNQKNLWKKSKKFVKKIKKICEKNQKILWKKN